MINVSPCFDPDYPFKEVTTDRSEYYLRQGEAPGRWTGDGARALGLAGEVSPAALRALFCGKHPVTGAYLASARGSSARAGVRSAGKDLDVRAAAARLGVPADQVQALLRSGDLAGEKRRSGAWRVSANALDAYEQGRPQPPALGNLPAPAADGTYSLAEVARLAGVNRSYLARLVAKGMPETTTRDDGRLVQYLVGHKDDQGKWRVASDELDRFMAGRVSARVVPAYDLAVRPPKSVSILHALGTLVPPEVLAARGLPTDLAGEVLAAHHAAVDDAIAVLERHAAWIRGKGGRVQAVGLTIAAFDHRSSRMGDPLLHTHLVVANVARGVDGRMAALDGTALYAWARPVGHVYQARLRAELTRRLGVEFHQPHNGVADLFGVPRAVIEEFSQRSAQRDALLAALGRFGPGAAQGAILATRPAKGVHAHQSPQRLAERAARVGFGPADLVRHVVGRARPQAPGAERVGEVAAELAGPEGLTQRSARVDLRDALCGFATALAEGASADQLETWASRLLHDPRRFVPVAAAPPARSEQIRTGDGRVVRAGGMGPSFTTPELLAHEARLVAAHSDGLGAGVGVVAEHDLEAALADRPTLRAEQAAMVEAITTSGHGVEVVVGGPGTGKTFALGAATAAWRSAGYRVLGACLQGGAAEVLGIEAGLDDQFTLARLLGECDRHGAGYLAGAVVVVDESGMADTRQLSRLAAWAGEAGAKLVLVGDPDQIPEVGAGGAFAHLVERCGDAVVALRENHRQADPVDRDRLGLIRTGRSAAAIASARAAGRWHDADSADAARVGLLSAWHADPGTAASDKLLVATTVAEVERLNAAARALLDAEGRLGRRSLVITLSSPTRAVDKRELRVGDRVRATRNNYLRRVRTGQVGTVVAIDTKGASVRVAFDARGDRPEPVVELDHGFLQEREVYSPAGRREIQAPGLTHAYASTANAVQGRTAERAYVLVAEAGMYRQAAYVSASRARLETHFFALATPDADELDCPSRPGVGLPPDPDETRALAEAMARDASQTMASAADPMAAAVGDLVARPTPWLAAERAELAARVGASPTLPAALRRVRAALAGTYGLAPEALECRPLDEAMARALAVPGATVERLIELVHSRQRPGTRELLTARDPVAVLVWAAGTYATGVLEAEARLRAEEDDRPPEVRRQEAEDRARLALLDAALVRQRDGRLFLAETERHGPVTAVLGPPPAHVVGLRAWRRAAAAVVDYRDAAGLFDRRTTALHGAHPLGPVPADPVLAGHREQLCAVVAAALVDIAVAEVARHVPPLADRPAPAVAELAEHPLPVLDAELASLRTAPGGGHGRQDPAVVLARARLVGEAIVVRERLLAARAVASPRDWLRADVAARCAGRRLDEGEASALAAAYGRLGAHLERAGDAVDQAEIGSLVDEDLAAQAARARHRAALGRLGMGPPEPPAHDLGLAR